MRLVTHQCRHWRHTKANEQPAPVRKQFPSRDVVALGRNGGLRGEKKQDVRSEENGCYRLERAHGTFVRMIPMPDYADPDHALAKFDNGVLTLTVPKLEPTRAASRTIDIG